MPTNHVLVTGAGGFIGHHLVKYLKKKGYFVRGVDIKEPEFEGTVADEFWLLDLRNLENCLKATDKVEQVYALAADMGGMGFIASHHSQIMENNILINTYTLNAARRQGVNRYFFASSACVYPEHRQIKANIAPLKEDDAIPAQPQDAYGWEKLFTERMLLYSSHEYDMETRIARFHNIYGPLGTWQGGREKVPAAMCRKIALAALTQNREVEVWGDGKQTRSFCYIDDCVEGIYRVMMSDYPEPLNLGSDRLVTVNHLVDIIAEIAGINVAKHYVTGPQGVRGRNSDNTRLFEVINWVPRISLEEGLRHTYCWVQEQVKTHLISSMN